MACYYKCFTFYSLVAFPCIVFVTCYIFLYLSIKLPMFALPECTDVYGYMPIEVINVTYMMCAFSGMMVYRQNSHDSHDRKVAISAPALLFAILLSPHLFTSLHYSAFLLPLSSSARH